jgi:hypothetical protein
LIFHEITPALRPPRNFQRRAVLFTSGETYLRRIVSNSGNFAYFGKPGWRANEWNFFRHFPESRMSCPPRRTCNWFGSSSRGEHRQLSSVKLL